ncbi:hypothetical protein HYW32_01985 [Candidatus Berkelbacteria bacterium]|nr:hypothetical protein [Candidatus Berkelbacteria bacterium]
MTPSWDLFLTILFIVGIAYGMMLQRERTVVTLVAVYVALVITQVLTAPISQFFAGEKTINSFFVSSQVSPFTIQASLFIGLMILVITKGGLNGDRGTGLLSPFEVFVYSFLNTALIVTTLLSFLPDEARAAMMTQSSMVAFLVNHHTWWLALPIASLIFFGWNRHPFVSA